MYFTAHTFFLLSFFHKNTHCTLKSYAYNKIAPFSLYFLLNRLRTLLNVHCVASIAADYNKNISHENNQCQIFHNKWVALPRTQNSSFQNHSVPLDRSSYLTFPSNFTSCHPSEKSLSKSLCIFFESPVPLYWFVTTIVSEYRKTPKRKRQNSNKLNAKWKCISMESNTRLFNDANIEICVYVCCVIGRLRLFMIMLNRIVRLNTTRTQHKYTTSVHIQCDWFTCCMDVSMLVFDFQFVYKMTFNLE